jgi:hypothetical protein
MKVKILYKTGGDETHEHGEYEVKETDKTIKLTLLKQGFYTAGCLPEGDFTFQKRKGYTLEKLAEVFYPMKAGTPCWIEFIK